MNEIATVSFSAPVLAEGGKSPAKTIDDGLPVPARKLALKLRVRVPVKLGKSELVVWFVL